MNEKESRELSVCDYDGQRAVAGGRATNRTIGIAPYNYTIIFIQTCLERPCLEVVDQGADEEGDDDGEGRDEPERRPAVLEGAPHKGAPAGVAAELEYLIGFSLGGGRKGGGSEGSGRGRGGWSEGPAIPICLMQIIPTCARARNNAAAHLPHPDRLANISIK